MPPPDAERSPLAELLSLAGPTIAQMASYTLMQFLDIWILSHYGQNRHNAIEPTAAANAGLFSYSIISFGMGILAVVNTLASQAFGRKDDRACGEYLWQGIWFAVLYYALVLVALPWLGSVYHAFGHEPVLAYDEALYQRIVLSACILKLIQMALSQFLLAIDRPRTVLMGTLCGVSVNAVAAYALVFGRFGLAPHGIRGAAWAQNIGVAVEMLTLIVLALCPSIRRRFYVLDFSPRVGQFWTLLKVGFGSGIQFTADILAWSLFVEWVMGRFGQEAMAANLFMFRFMMVSFMPAIAIGIAVTALVGRYIGMGRPDVAAQRAHLGFKVALIYMMACGVFFIVGRHALIQLFTDNPHIRAMGAMLLIFAAVYEGFDAMYIVYAGALRGAGDTFVPALVTGMLCWGITVGGGYAVARLWPSFGPAGPWMAATIYGILLGCFMLARFTGGRWRRISLAPRSARSQSAADSDKVTSVAASSQL